MALGEAGGKIEAELAVGLKALGNESDHEKRMSIGDGPPTARFAVRVLPQQFPLLTPRGAAGWLPPDTYYR